MYSRFAKAFYLLSVLLFIVLFMYIYAALPEQVAYRFNELGQAVAAISRDTFFYIGLATFLVLNFILITPGKMIEKQSTMKFKRLFPVGDPFRDQILAWIYSFASIINVSTVIIAFYIHSLNNQEEIRAAEFNPFFYMVPFFFLVWIILLFVILGNKLKQVRA